MSKHLIYMLAKIEYGRISKSKFNEGKDKIIEDLRKDFPHVQHVKKSNTYRFEFKHEGVPEVVTDTDPVLTLLSSNKAWGIRISPVAIVLHTRQYEGYTDFHERLLNILARVNNSFNITHISFVGMRYVNNFDYDPSYEFKEYFLRMDFLQPMLNSWGRAGSNMTARYGMDTEAININSGVMMNAPKYLPDLIEFASDLDEGNNFREGIFAHLDIDSYYYNDELVDFSFDFISEKTKVLRDNANKAFFDIINVK